MILQYCLSVYSLNFFVQPTFTTFKIRIINQQNGDCNDSRILDSRKLDSNTFPVIVKIKGMERLLIKIKLLNLGSKGETAIGEGVVSFDKNNIDDSLRIPIYDKSKGIEEVAICSLDLFISGHPLDRNTSLAVDKSKSKIDDWRQHTEDAIFSQMSFTVQSDSELASQQISGKKAEKPKEKPGSIKQKVQVRQKEEKQRNKQQKPNGYMDMMVGQRQQFVNEKLEKKVQEEQDKNNITEYAFKRLGVEKDAPLLNSAYLSEESKRNFNRPKSPLPEQLPKAEVCPTPSAIVLQGGNSETVMSGESLSPERIRQRLKENEQLMGKLRRYLQLQGEVEVKRVSSRQPKHKIRRRKVKVQQPQKYHSGTSFIEYLKFPQGPHLNLLKGFKVIKSTSLELQDISETEQEVLINRLVVWSQKQQKIVVVDLKAYRSSRGVVEFQEQPHCIRVPEGQTIKIVVSLESIGDFQGSLGLQEGQHMAIKLRRSRKNIQLDNNVLSSNEYKFIFSIQKHRQHQHHKNTPPLLTKRESEVSFRQAQQIFHGQDIRSRIRSLSLQPWGYGHSHLSNLNHSTHAISLGIKRPLIQKAKEKEPTGVSRQLHEDKAEGVRANQKTSEQLETDRPQVRESKKVEGSVELSRASSNQQTKKGSKVDSSSRSEIDAINKIRNGNRNNYLFKESRTEGDRSKHQQPIIKRMWEQLLMKMKREEDHIQKQKIQQAKRQVQSVLHLEKERKKKLSLEARAKQRTDHGRNPQSKEVTKVSKTPKVQQGRSFPLRSMRLEVKNISITQPQLAAEEDLEEEKGQFVRFCIRDRATYFTEIIFSEGFNSVLWKLSGCYFGQLLGIQRLEVQIFKTIGNQIIFLGKSAIRISKLYFLRNNHIYNGKIASSGFTTAQFTLGFEIQEFFPYQIIEQGSHLSSNLVSSPLKKHPSNNQHPISPTLPDKQSFDIRKTADLKERLEDGGTQTSQSPQKGLTLKKTLRKQRRQQVGEASLLKEEMGGGMEADEEIVEGLPKGLQYFD